MDLTVERAIVLLSQMYLPQFDDEEKEALSMAIYTLEKQTPKKPRTQFERIKAMSIDEMADFIIKETNHCDFCSRKNSPTCVAVEGGCKKYIKMYLESEVDT